ncbi:hypothetical protein DWG18_02505 [Lysobacter sp. TY2-98]|nr:hypothetical protein DWG18_02505 [Lysobacter sp. TY2-98]
MLLADRWQGDDANLRYLPDTWVTPVRIKVDDRTVRGEIGAAHFKSVLNDDQAVSASDVVLAQELLDLRRRHATGVDRAAASQDGADVLLCLKDRPAGVGGQVTILHAGNGAARREPLTRLCILFGGAAE